MKRWLALVVIATMLTVPVASGAEWLRSGYDPGRTGAIPFEGPQTNDTAFQVQLPGVPIGPTLVVDGEAYLATLDADRFGFDGDTRGLDTEAIWRIELATGEVTQILELPDGADPELITPQFLFYEDEDDFVAMEIPTGDEVWRARAAESNPLIADRDYLGVPLLVEERLYIGFSTARGADATTPVGGPSYWDGPSMGVMALDSRTGETLWERSRTEEPQRLDGDPRDLYGDGITLSADEQRVYAYFKIGIEDGPMVNPERLQYELWALDIEDGDVLWNRSDTARREVAADTPAGTTTLVNEAGDTCCAWPVVTPTAVHIRLEAFQALNKADGTEVWTSPAGSTDQVRVQGATSMGARGDVFIGTSPQTVYRLDAVGGDLDWLKNAASPSQVRIYGLDPVALDEDTAYLPVLEDTCGLGGVGFEARDVETGEVDWAWRHLPDVGREGCSVTTPSRAAFGPGAIVVGTNDGTVHVIGETEASLGEPDVEAEKFPGEGQQVEIDASGAAPGAFGEASRYMVDWGDGTISGWQASPTFTHVYNESGEFEAQVYAGNEANQTSSTVATMNVGKEEPNWLSERFEPENQEMTFGVLGITMALGGGIIGIARRRRKRANLQAELDALEQGFEDTKDQPSECEAFLDTRKARTRSLALDGKLEEDQVGIIENRAEELRRELRTGAVEAEFGFLPHALVGKARKMLEDGEVTDLEAEAFLSALEDAEFLRDEQRALVRERIERWHGRDAGGSNA